MNKVSMKRRVLYIRTFFSILLLATCNQAYAQDPYFSQFYQTSLYRNPALIGVLGGSYSAGVIYRSQWNSLGTAFNTIMASAEGKIMINKEVHDYLSFGLCVNNDKAGSIDYSSTDVYAGINYNKSLEDRHHSFLSMGFTAAYKQNSFDPSKMTVDNQFINGGFDNSLASGENFTSNKISYIDVSAGISYNTSFGAKNENAFYIGAAAFHLLRPYSSFYSNTAVKRSVRWSANMGFVGRITETVGWLYHTDVQIEKPHQQIVTGGMLSWVGYKDGGDKKMIFSAGAFYRFQDAIIPTIKIDYSHCAVTFSYDYASSAKILHSGTFASYEISFYVNGNSKNIPISNGLTCPRFSNFDDY